MPNPFADIPTRGGSYVKFETPGEFVTGTIVGTRVGKNFDGDKDVPEIILNINGEEKILGCENAALHNWAVKNGEAVAASVGQPLTVTYTGKAGQVKLYNCEIGGPAAQAAPAVQPAPAVPTEAPQAPLASPSSLA